MNITKFEKRPIIICDLDGTLSDYRHRMHLHPAFGKEGSSYALFNEQAIFDKPISLVIDILDKFKSDAVVKIVTARPVEFTFKTRDWLNEHKVRYDALYMRPAGNLLSDAVLKREIWEHQIAKDYHPIFAIDDRDCCVAMWRSLGITCLQPTKGLY